MRDQLIEILVELYDQNWFYIKDHDLETLIELTQFLYKQENAA